MSDLVEESGKSWPIDNHFDETAASTMARLESYNKHIYRPNTYLHKWWARRCGTTFRYILKQLVRDPKAKDYYSAGGLEGKVILDPMFGGGTTLHEAIRLGANAIGLDIDPIPILQARATLTPVNTSILTEEFDVLCRNLAEVLTPLYRTSCPTCFLEVPLQFMLYGLFQQCECRSALFLDSTVLRTQSDGSQISICSYCHQLISGRSDHHCDDIQNKSIIYDKKKNRCDKCQAPFHEELDVPYYARYVPVAVARRCPDHGFQLGPVPSADLEMLERANSYRQAYHQGKNMVVVPGPKTAALFRKRIRYYEDLFSSRQLIYLHEAISFISNCEISIGLNLALLVSTSLDLNTMLCGYKGTEKRRAGAIRHVFSHHAYTFPYTALENNPIYPEKVSGSLRRFYSDRIKRGKAWAKLPAERVAVSSVNRFIPIDGETDLATEVETIFELAEGKRRIFLKQGSAAQIPTDDDFVDFIVTDPPYYDSVQYHDLAPFFNVWLERLLPIEAQQTVDWRYDRALAAVGEAKGGKSGFVRGPYLDNLTAIFTECFRVLKSSSGRLIFTFHHWKPLAWTALTIALLRSQFKLLNYYIVYSENPMSVHIANLRSLKHDAILVLAPTTAKVRSEWSLPKQSRPGESRDFCGYCAQLLGFLLNEDLSDKVIQKTWEDLLSESSD